MRSRAGGRAAVLVSGTCLILAARLLTGASDPARFAVPRPPLTVLTLNVAHGRGDSPGLFVDEATARANLDRITGMLRRERPDVVTLQEADAASFWSGGFDHVARLADSSGLTYRVHGHHVDSPGLRYGTALLSREPISDAESVRFEPTPLLPPKGFVVATVAWPGDRGPRIDVVSVHLDPLRREVREAQAARLVAALRARGRPLVVAGDFNCDWDDEPTLPRLCDELGLRAYCPDDPDAATFPSTGRRLDWILCSRDLRFRECRLVTDPLSDHQAVTATLESAPRIAD